MKTSIQNLPNLARLVALVLLSTLNLQLSTFAQGTAFTYQGRFNDGANEANGAYDLRFAAFQNPTGGGAVLGPITNSAVSASNGLFTTLLDFGPYNSAAYGRGRWLEISARTNGSVPWTVLSPRQPVTPAPSAIYAAYAGGPAPGDALNATHLGGLDSSSFWQTGGNGGTTPGLHFLGSTDNQPLELRVNNQPALRLSYATSTVFTSPNLVGGASVNRVNPGFVGGVIGGGGELGTGIYPSYPNVVNANFGSIGGGFGNTAGGFVSVVGGGRFNFSGGGDSFIGSGYGNTNSLFAEFATIGGGHYNTVTASWGTVPGGANNTVGGRYGFAAGRRAKAVHQGAFVWADSQDADFVSTAADQFAVRAAGGFRLDGNQTINGQIRLNSAFGFSQSSLGFFSVDAPFIAGGRFTVSTDGNVGIGQPSPSVRLDVQADQAVGRFTTINNPNGAVLVLRNTSASSIFLGAVNFENSGGTPGQISYTVNDAMSFRVANAEGMRLEANGNLNIRGVFGNLSDRNVKANRKTVDSREVLERLVALPVQSWTYTNQPGVKHLGPMAQDFHDAFGLNGPDDKHIATVDADGVALAAIQGLNQKLEEQLKQKDERLNALEQQISELKQLVVKSSGTKD